MSAARRGWFVFPVAAGQKRPPLVRRWEHAAQDDPGRVARSWRPGANVGIACGPSGLVVIDLDPPDGLESFRQMAAGRDCPPTYTVATPRGGQHLYFAVPPGCQIRSSAGQLGEHIDVRAGGGYVVGAGSIVNGRPYEDVTGLPLAPLPAWVAETLAPPPRRRPLDTVVPLARSGSYADAALRGEIGTILTTARGGRNAQLNRSAFALGQLTSAGMLNCAEVTASLIRAADACGLVADDGLRQCENTIESGLTAGRANPRPGAA